MVKHTLQQMSIDSIVPSKDNARRIDQKSEGFQELVNSIRAGGVAIPIHVWPHPKRKGKYEIRAGERRWRACKSLKHKTVPTIVHYGIGYDVAMALTYTENKFREDLAPLEEVEEIARCMDHLKSDAKLIANLLGQTEQWVRLRANIHRNLTQGWRQAFLSRDKYKFFNNWSIGHLTLVARLPASSQKELLAEIGNYHWQWENVSVHDLDGRISSSLMLLIRAKWNLDDDTLLPKAGSCSECNKRSGAEPVLWFGATGNQIKAKDRCLDLQCWKSKMYIYLQQRAKQLSEKYSNLAYIATEHLSENEKDKLSKTFGRVLDQYDVQRSTKGSKGSFPVLVVHGKGAGMINFVKEKRFAKPAGAKRAGRVTPLKERRAHLTARRWSQVLIVMREKTEAAGVDQVVYKDKLTGIMALAAIYGNQSVFPGMEDENRKSIAAMIKLADKDGREKALALLWSSMKPTFARLLSCSVPVSQTPGYAVATARWIAELIKVDIDKIFNDVSEQKGFTEPKSWKSLNADGTSKVAKKGKSNRSDMQKNIKTEEKKFTKKNKKKKSA